MKAALLLQKQLFSAFIDRRRMPIPPCAALTAHLRYLRHQGRFSVRISRSPVTTWAIRQWKLVKALEGEQVESFIDSGSKVVDSTNCDEYIDDMKAKSLGEFAADRLHVVKATPHTECGALRKILCPDFFVKVSRQYIKYYRKTVPRQYAKFTRKSLLFNYAVLPF